MYASARILTSASVFGCNPSLKAPPFCCATGSSCSGCNAANSSSRSELQNHSSPVIQFGVEGPGEISMTKRCHFLLAAAFATVLSIPSLALAQQAASPISGAWSGTIVYSSCNADEAFNESPECFRATPGAKLSLYDDTNRVMYSLEPQALATGHLGDSVTVRGTLDGETIHATSLELMSIGLAVGQKAPNFSLHDQFGRTQSLDSLKGANGTVLLFFRSADW